MLLDCSHDDQHITELFFLSFFIISIWKCEKISLLTCPCKADVTSDQRQNTAHKSE